MWKCWCLTFLWWMKASLGDRTLFFQSKKPILFCHNMMTHKNVIAQHEKLNKYEKHSHYPIGAMRSIDYFYGDEVNVCSLHFYMFLILLIFHFHHYTYQFRSRLIYIYYGCIRTVFKYILRFQCLHSDSVAYNATVNIPFGVAHYRSKSNPSIVKLFVSIPRRNPGIPSTLNVVELNGNSPHLNPLLIGYPSYQVNTPSVSMINLMKT